MKILCVGRKGRDQLRRDFGSLIIDTIEEVGQAAPDLRRAPTRIAARIAQMFEAGEFDVCTIVYNRFKSAMTQIVTAQQLIPFAPPAAGAAATAARPAPSTNTSRTKTEILAELLPRNLSVQVFRALLENARQRAGRAHDRDGQRHAQRRRHDQPPDHQLQPRRARPTSPRN